MPKLTDTQLVILSAAAQRKDGAVLPLPTSLKIAKARATTTLKGLVNRGVITEQPAARNQEAWRKTQVGERVALVITKTGLEAIGAGTDDGSRTRPRGAKVQPKPRKPGNSRAANGRRVKPKALQTGVRSGTKQALIIELLGRKNGATIAEIVDASGWQPYSVRGAISGTLKKKLGLTVESAVVDSRGRVYRIVDGHSAT